MTTVGGERKSDRDLNRLLIGSIHTSKRASHGLLILAQFSEAALGLRGLSRTVRLRLLHYEFCLLKLFLWMISWSRVLSLATPARCLTWPVYFCELPFVLYVRTRLSTAFISSEHDKGDPKDVTWTEFSKMPDLHFFRVISLAAVYSPLILLSSSHINHQANRYAPISKLAQVSFPFSTYFHWPKFFCSGLCIRFHVSAMKPTTCLFDFGKFS